MIWGINPQQVAELEQQEMKEQVNTGKNKPTNKHVRVASVPHENAASERDEYLGNKVPFA